MNETLKAPFPYFGGKSLIAETVWQAFGDVCNYVEPFAGSLAVLLARPTPFTGSETINDWSCHVVNVWRAIQAAPEALARLCVAPVAEVNTEAQHAWLMRHADALRNALGDPHAYDLEAAAWWIKGCSEWISCGWCGGDGPWQWSPDSGWYKIGSDSGMGVKRPLPHLGDSGSGVNRKLPHLGNAGSGYYEQRVAWLADWLCALRDRICGVRMACGDWLRVANSESTTTRHGLTAVFLDPPYEGTEYVYGKTESLSASVRDWCFANGANPLFRIILCGRAEEHDALLAKGWRKQFWKTRKGYSDKGADTEALWLSPHCVCSLKANAQADLFETEAA